MNKKKQIAFVFLFFICKAWAQFPPAAGQVGSTAIFADSSVFTGWANEVEIERGYVQIDEPSLGYADYGVGDDALGKADNLVVSLGDGGSAVFYFDPPLMNGQGPDFAVFENSLWNNFLELCFVEVSSDGENFVRFPAISNVPNDVQLGGFGTMDASLIHNFGGKYRTLFGTPFDLEELKNQPALDVDQVSHVRLVDVVGNIDPAYASYGSQGNIVNDPWPTPWSSSGFDLDALGIIHQAVGVDEFQSSKGNIEILFLTEEQKMVVRIKSISKKASAKIYNLSGQLQHSFILNSTENKIELNLPSSGLYLIQVQSGFFSRSEKIIIR